MDTALPAAPPPPVDSDGDGVLDERDACPNTPAGVPVDERGCPVDLDSDGVADYLDQCPDTRSGVRVDSLGCPAIPPERYRVKVYFNPKRALVRSEIFSRLDSLAALLIETGAAVEIIGYADQAGSLDFNLLLSDSRARVVRDYLITGGINSGQLQAAGRGRYPQGMADPELTAGEQRKVEINLLEK